MSIIAVFDFNIDKLHAARLNRVGCFTMQAASVITGEKNRSVEDPGSFSIT